MKPQAKVSRVMREFKKGDLKSSSGQKVTNPKQAIAIGLSEAGISKKAKGGEMKESKAMMKKEVSFMKKKGAPKSMLKHEMKEAGMKKGGGVKKMAMGGTFSGRPAGAADPKPAPSRPLTTTQTAPGRSFADVKRQMLASPTNVLPSRPGMPGSSSSGRSFADVNRQMLASPTNVNPVRPGAMKKGGAVKKMAGGGLAAGHKSADGVASKGKTKAKQIVMKGAGKGMKKGGYC